MADKTRTLASSIVEDHDEELPLIAPDEDCGGGADKLLEFDAGGVVNDVDIPETAPLTTADLHNLLAAHRSPGGTSSAWRLWLLVGSRYAGGQVRHGQSTAP